MVSVIIVVITAIMWIIIAKIAIIEVYHKEL